MKMASEAGTSGRVFKTAWFSRAARKAHIADGELCSAIRQVILGQADDLGGGVYKKRLGKNLYRSIIVTRGAGIGSMPISSQRRIGQISETTSWQIFAI
jgi:RelE toxin of RelE / RelB toxin-antitoxin system